MNAEGRLSRGGLSLRATTQVMASQFVSSWPWVLVVRGPISHLPSSDCLFRRLGKVSRKECHFFGPLTIDIRGIPRNEVEARDDGRRGDFAQPQLPYLPWALPGSNGFKPRGTERRDVPLRRGNKLVAMYSFPYSRFSCPLRPSSSGPMGLEQNAKPWPSWTGAPENPV